MSLFRNHNLVTKKNQKNNKKNQQTFVRWAVSLWDYFLCTKLSPPIVSLRTDNRLLLVTGSATCSYPWV